MNNSSNNSNLFDDNYGDDDFLKENKASDKKPIVNEYSNMFENTKDKKSTISQQNKSMQKSNQIKSSYEEEEESYEDDYEDDFETEKKTENNIDSLKTPILDNKNGS